MVTPAGTREFGILERLSRISQGATVGMTVRSALNPLLKLCALTTPTCLVAAYLFRDHPIVLAILIATALLPVYCACAGFFFFAKTQPNRLQSEEFQLRHEAVNLIQTRSFTSPGDPSLLAQIAMAPLHQLESGSE